MDTLNKEQKYAATYCGKHLLVLAGAGTGKTRTIIARAKHLIQSGVQAKRILILSFTRKAANEIVERIQQEIPETQSEGLQGSTFHSWCMSIVKNHPNIFPQSNYTLLNEEDQESCFRARSLKIGVVGVAVLGWIWVLIGRSIPRYATVDQKPKPPKNARGK